VIIIAFAGQARAGKTTLANSFAKACVELGFTPYFRSFADPIKADAAKLGLFKDKNPLAYREYCQDRGKTMRDADPNYWVKAFADNLEKVARTDAERLDDSVRTDSRYSEAVVLIDDLRYENEYELIRNLHGHVVLVTRASLPEKDAEWRGHESEEFGNYWSTAEQQDREAMFSAIIDNDVESEDFEAMDILALQICDVFTSETTYDSTHISARVEEFPEDVKELMDLFRKLREMYEEMDDDDSDD
jgi:hypothetical protein